MMRLICAVTLAAAGCASTYLRRAPPSPSAPWPFAAEPTPLPSTPDSAPQVTRGRVYELPELVDLAESTNPDTRIGWERARQAALEVGVSTARYFPTVAATALFGYQHTSFPVPHLAASTLGINPFQILPNVSFPVPELPSGRIGVDTWQLLPFVSARWEVFNAGRAADVRAAKSLSTAANELFTADHEKVIFEVARAFYRLNAARAQVAVSRDALERTRAIATAAEARYGQGVATVVETTEARRDVAQGEYNVAQARALEVATRAALVSAIGIDPQISLDVASTTSGALPAQLSRGVDVYVKQALTARADLRAARARLPAADAVVSRSTATYLPRVTVIGTVGTALLGGQIDRVDLPNLTLPNYTVGVNFEWVLVDGGLREIQTEIAHSQHAEAVQQLVKIQQQVVQEVVTAYNQANASLAGYQAATALYETATTAEAAATKSYLGGLATLTDAMNAQKILALASAAKEQAFADALVAMTTLAFAGGELLSAKALPSP